MFGKLHRAWPASLVLVMGLAGFAGGGEYERSPNPNLGQNTITIASGEIANNNSEPFENFGAIVVQNGGTLKNVTEMDILIDEDSPGGELATIEVQVGGTLETVAKSVMNFDSVSHFNLSGTVDNYGSIRADWSFQLLLGSQFNNYGDMQNKQGSSLRGTADNQGFFGNLAPALDSAGYMQQVGLFTNQENATLLNQGEFVNFATIDNHGTIKNEVYWTSGIGRGIFRNGGTLNNLTAGDVTNRHRWFNTGTLNNSGLFTNHAIGLGFGNMASAVIDNLSGGTFQNDRVINNSGEIRNAGTFIINTGFSFSSAVQGTGTYTQTVGDTIVLSSLGGSLLDFQGGTVSGDGSLVGPVVIADGATISSGSSAGMMLIDGSLDLSGTVKVELESLVLFDVVDVMGSATLGATSTLDITFLNDFVPSTGNYFDLLVAEDISGTIHSVNMPIGFSDPYRLLYLADEIGTRDVVRLSFTPVPTTDGDINEDGNVDSTDLNLLLSDFNIPPSELDQVNLETLLDG